MRHKIVTILTAGAVGVTGFAVAAPALAASTTPAAGVATAVTSQVDRIKQALAGLVSDKTLTQAQANKVAETLKSTDLGHGGRRGPGGPGGLGGPGGHRGGFGQGLSAAATALKMTEADLRTALEGGKTLATVAKEKKVPVADLTASLVKAGKARIAEGVKDGRLTQAQADERLKALTTRVTQLINGARPARSNHDHGFAPGGVPTGTGAATPSV